MQGRPAKMFMNKASSWWAANRKSIVLTFEIFWLLIFFLDRVTNVNAVEIPQFIYVNF